MRISRLCLLLSLILLSLFALQCETSSTSTHTPPVYQQNEEVLFDNISYRISDIFWTQEAGPRFLKKKANASFLVINLTLTNRAHKPVDKVFNPIFKLEDTEGSEYESSQYIFITDGLEMKMMMQPLNPNVSLQGYIVFDVPQRNKYRLRILSPFYAREAFRGSVKLIGSYFYFDLKPTQTIGSFEH